jgi:hypothetical protein
MVGADGTLSWCTCWWMCWEVLSSYLLLPKHSFLHTKLIHFFLQLPQLQRLTLLLRHLNVALLDIVVVRGALMSCQLVVTSSCNVPDMPVRQLAAQLQLIVGASLTPGVRWPVWGEAIHCGCRIGWWSVLMAPWAGAPAGGCVWEVFSFFPGHFFLQWIRI